MSEETVLAELRRARERLRKTGEHIDNGTFLPSTVHEMIALATATFLDDVDHILGDVP